MHVMVAAGSLTPANASSVQSAVEQTLSAGHAFTQAFQGVYIVTVANEADRNALAQTLIANVKAADPRGVVLVTPPMSPTAGPYTGLLQPELWPELNSRIT